MKILAVKANNRRKCFEVRTRNRAFEYPYAKCSPKPASDDGIARAFVDEELGREGFSYLLKSGREGSVHIEQVLEFNRDPSYLRDLLAYQLTLEARKALAASGLSKREAIRRMHTSPTQLYRLLDPARSRKSVDQLLRLLAALGHEVQVKVLAKSA